MKNTWRVTALLLLCVIPLTSCFFGGGTSEISVDDLEQQIAIKMSNANNTNTMIRLNAVTCYDPLPSTAGAQSRCAISDEGVTFWVTAVSQGEVDGATNFELVYD